MGKHDKSPTKSRVKLRFVEFEVEGDSDHIIEGVKSVMNQFSRGSPSPGAPRVLPRVPADSEETPPAHPPAHEEAVEGDAIIDADDEPSKKESPARARRVKTPAPEQLDLQTPPTVPDFIVAYPRAKQNTDRVLVAAAWLREHRNLAAFKVGHLVTFFRTASWNHPTDYVQTVKDMVRKTGQLEKAGEGAWSLSLIGENELNELKK